MLLFLMFEKYSNLNDDFDNVYCYNNPVRSKLETLFTSHILFDYWALFGVKIELNNKDLQEIYSLMLEVENEKS